MIGTGRQIEVEAREHAAALAEAAAAMRARVSSTVVVNDATDVSGFATRDEVAALAEAVSKVAATMDAFIASAVAAAVKTS